MALDESGSNILICAVAKQRSAGPGRRKRSCGAMRRGGRQEFTRAEALLAGKRVVAKGKQVMVMRLFYLNVLK